MTRKVPAAARAKSSDTGDARAKPAFVGRDDDLAAVVEALDEPSLVFIEGEAGIGKTRLLRESLAARPDDRVLVAGCAPWRDPFPLGPVVVGLRRLWQHVGVVELSPLGGALRPLFPEWADKLPPVPEPLDDPKETRHRVLCALTELVERLEVDVLVVEDAHWADTATLEWLLMLAATDRTSDDHMLSMVVTFRPTDIPDDSLLPRLTARTPAGLRVVRVDLHPLDIASTRLFVGSMLHAEEVSEKFATFLHEHADGLPLALEETVRLLRDRHDIVRQGGAWTRRVLDDLEVPPAVRDSVLERVTRLDPDAQQILQAAAIVGDPADETLLPAVANIDEPAGRRGVTVALVSGLLHEITPGRYAFRHILDSQAVESAIPVSERRRLHHRAAEVLKAGDHPSVARLARHYREAGDTETWSQYAEAAADLALEAGDDRTAVTTLLDILNTVEHPIERRARLARKLGNSAFFGAAGLGDLAERVVNVLRSVLAHKDLPRGERGEMRLLYGRMLSRIGQELNAMQEFESAIPDLSDQPELAIRAMSNLALLVVTTEWTADRHLEWLRRAEELLPSIESPSERLSFGVIRASILLKFGLEAGWEAAASLPSSAPSQAERGRLANGWWNLGQDATAWGRYDRARQWLEVAMGIADSIGNQRMQNNIRAAQAYIDWYTGVWDGLADRASELAAAEASVPMIRLEACQIVRLLDLMRHLRSGAERRLLAVSDEYTRLGVTDPAILLTTAALVRLYVCGGDNDRALELTAPKIAVISRKGMWLWATDIAPVHVDALVAAGRVGDAESFVGQLVAGLGDVDAPAPQAAQATCRAIMAEAHGDPDRAAELFGEAANAWAALPRPYDELLALERQGRCLLAAGEQEKGLAVLSDTQKRLHQLGASWDADRTAHVLRRHGVEVARPNRRGPRGYGDQLSPRELQVVELVGRGMTNKQIGEQLFLSPKTVDRHLRSARRKLGASTRIGVAMAASEAGLLASTKDPAV